MQKTQRIIATYLAALWLALPASAEMLKLGGTGGGLGPMQLLAEAFTASNPNVEIEVLPSLGSGGGIKALIAGAIDIAVSSRPLKEKEMAKGVIQTPYGSTPVVFATSDENPESELSTSQINDMFAGEISKWGDGEPVRLVLRQDGSADRRIIEKGIPGLTEAMALAHGRRGVPMAYNVQESVDTIQSLRWGLGVTSLSVILSEKRPLKALTIDNVEPTPKNLSSGSYVLRKDFYLVTPSQASESVKRFEAFVLSPAGADILRENGHLVPES